MRNSDKITTGLATFAIVAGLGLVYATFYAGESRQDPSKALVDAEPTNTLAFPELQGPSHATALPVTPPPRTTPADYGKNSSNSLAVLLKDSNSSWLGLAHGLKSIGIPFEITTSTEQALEHSVIIIYPAATGANTSTEERESYYKHVQQGKTLIGFSVIGGGLSELFGFRSSTERNNLRSMEFAVSDTSRGYASDQSESQIPLTSLSARENRYPGVSFNEPIREPLAQYADGSAAIVQNVYQGTTGTGRAVAIGLDFGHYILRAQNGRFVQFTDSYANSYQPKVDTLLRFLASLYKQGEPNAILVSPTPNNKAFTALVTHDVDYTRSIYNAVDYAEFEREAEVSATYFIQTKYVTDYNDSLFFQSSIIPLLKNLQSLGAEIASHSVAHSNEFSSMELGSGLEEYPDYRPFVQDFETVRNASIGGELRVSKFLLESIVGQEVTAFRPGHLSLPQSLPQMLHATQYKYGSSITANEALTHLPFRTNFDRNYDTELPIYEFPVTIEDEQGNLGDRIDDAIALSENIARYAGLVNLLIHTDVMGHKLEFERQYVDRFKDSAWFTTVSEFGDWWAMRDSVRFELKRADNQIQLQILADGTLAGLTLQVPESWRLEQGVNGSSQTSDRVVVGEFDGETSLRFNLH